LKFTKTQIDLMKTIERKEISLKLTDAHPLNRQFLTEGKGWEEFREDVASRGIQEDLVVRWAPELNDRYQVLRGHRRRYAGLEAKAKKVWAVVVDCSDEEAFEYMWEGNLFREDVNPADEAMAVRVMLEEFGKTVEQLAAKWHRSVEWIRTRQQLLDLGDEVLEAVAKPGRDRLTMGAVEQILRVPEEYREEAVQLVLHPVMGTLSEEDAREVIQRCLLEPKAAEAAWESERRTVTKSWRKRLELLCLPKTKGDLIVSSKGVTESRELLRGSVVAEDMVPLKHVLPDAPVGLRWLHLAVRHNAPVLILPGAEGGESRAIVNMRMLTDAEAAMAEHGGGNWLVQGRQKAVMEAPDYERRVEKATADLAAGYDTAVDVAEAPRLEIDQRMERSAMLRLGEVNRLWEWADVEQEGEPEWLPEWVKEHDASPWLVKAVCDWIESLKI
jgi:ParB/RepB/Spo0J family partition protein